MCDSNTFLEALFPIYLEYPTVTIATKLPRISIYFKLISTIIHNLKYPRNVPRCTLYLRFFMILVAPCYKRIRSNYTIALVEVGWYSNGIAKSVGQRTSSGQRLSSSTVCCSPLPPNSKQNNKSKTLFGSLSHVTCDGKL